MRHLMLITAALLTGCTMRDPTAGLVLTQADRARCDYESRAATAGIRSGIEAGWQQGELRSACLRAADAANRERGMAAPASAAPPESAPMRPTVR